MIAIVSRVRRSSGLIDGLVAGVQAQTGSAGDGAKFVERLLEEDRKARFVPLVSIKDLAAELGVCVRTLRRWNNRPGAPQRVKKRRRLMYRRDDVRRWLEQSGGTLGGRVTGQVEGASP